MRNRLRKSSRAASVSSTRSNSNTLKKGARKDAIHNPEPAPNDLIRPSVPQAPQTSAHSHTMGNNSGPTHEDKLLPNDQNTAGLERKRSTIRTVTSFDDKLRPSFEDELSSDGSPSVTRNSNSAFSSSVNSTLSAASTTTSQVQHNGQKTPDNRVKHSTLAQSFTPLSAASPDSPVEMPPTKSSGDMAQHDNNLDDDTKATAVSGGAMADGVGTNGWDSTVGKAGLGKTGRVINRLVSDNEALKRDLQIERLKAEEARQAARLLEDKMERLVSDYESRLLEASVTKTLLARKERQVESLQGAVDLEQQRTSAAKERERTWRDEMERVKKDTKREVEEATTQAALMESRYNAISSHWRDQGETVKQAMSRMGKEIAELVAARRQDDDKITTLRDLCDQQDGNIRVLSQQKEAISRKFEEYKQEQEDALRDIKTNAVEREAQQERTLEEARQVLDKLKWALNVKKNIEWAE